MNRNRNVDGTEVTNAQMVAMCEQLGLTKALAEAASTHYPDMARSILLQATAKFRLAEMFAGRLKLDTSVPFKSRDTQASLQAGITAGLKRWKDDWAALGMVNGV
jgi:hypothetical protein